MPWVSRCAQLHQPRLLARPIVGSRSPGAHLPAKRPRICGTGLAVFELVERMVGPDEIDRLPKVQTEAGVECTSPIVSRA